MGDAWLHEVKFDGYRRLPHKAGQDVLIFKNCRDFANRFPGIRDALLSLPCRSAIIDGEVVACNKDGTPVPTWRRSDSSRYERRSASRA